MEKFYIKNEIGKVQGILNYNSDNKEFTIDIDENIDLKTCPAFLYMAYKKDMKHIDEKLSMIFVKNRIVPEDRQNIDEILKAFNLDTYDPYEILKITKGKCCMDECYVEKEEAEAEAFRDTFTKMHNLVKDDIPWKNEEEMIKELAEDRRKRIEENK